VFHIMWLQNTTKFFINDFGFEICGLHSVLKLCECELVFGANKHENFKKIIIFLIRLVTELVTALLYKEKGSFEKTYEM